MKYARTPELARKSLGIFLKKWRPGIIITQEQSTGKFKFNMPKGKRQQSQKQSGQKEDIDANEDSATESEETAQNVNIYADDKRV